MSRLPGCVLIGSILLLAGCHSTLPANTSADPATMSEAAKAAEEARNVAQASLGKQAEVLAHGNLAQNGLEQILVVNRSSTTAEASRREAPASSPVLVTRAAVLQRDGGKWSQVLLCDEHLKNPYGYLGGSHAVPANGWRLEYRQDPQHGLEMKFTPAERLQATGVNDGEDSQRNEAAFDVRWNKSAKRYQSYDQSHERYLGEIPSLETPQSILK